MTEPIPPDESQRLQALQDYDVLDTAPEKDFDDLTFLAAQICGAPIAMISLVDADRLWFKAKVGIDRTEMPRSLSFCQYTILSDDQLTISDATLDPNFADNPFVTGPTGLRFYAGSPLITPTGARIGALCVVDRVARELTESQKEALRVLSRQVMAQLETRRGFRELAARERSLEDALEELRSAQARSWALYDSVLDSLVVTDADGKIESANTAAQRVFGYGKEELTGQSFGILLAEARDIEWDATGGEISAFLRAETARTRKRLGFGREVIGRRSNDEYFPLEISVNEVSLKDQILYIAVMRDMSERKRIDILKHEFISVVSHELRTPLTSIHGSLSLLQGGIAGELPQQFQKLLQIALKNSERLTRLINDILDIEKIEAGKMDFRLRPVSLLPWLENVLETNRAYADQLDVSLCLNIGPEVPSNLKVMVDSERLMQVMTNLLSNAAKFSPPHDVVTISVDLNTTASPVQLRVSVVDHGPGIQPEARPHIFEKFVQADVSDTRRKGGTGLGLSIARAIIEKMGGHIDYVSEPGHGATFYFEIPLVPFEPDATATSRDAAPVGNAGTQRVRHNGKFIRGLPPVVTSALSREAIASAPGSSPATTTMEPPAEADRPAEAASGPLRILLCEDDPDLVQLLSLILTDVAEPVFAMTLREARDRLEEEHFDLVILDPGLPDGSGLVLLPELNGHDGPPVIIFSAANVDQESARQAASTLVKSRHSHQDLLTAIRDVLTTENAQGRGGVSR